MSKSDRNLIEKSHNSFEIDGHDAKDDHHNEFKGLSASHNKPESIMSSSFVNASVDLGNQQSVNDNYLAGVGLMVITTLCWSIMHIICKLIYTRTPEMSSFDILN